MSEVLARLTTALAAASASSVNPVSAE